MNHHHQHHQYPFPNPQFPNPDSNIPFLQQPQFNTSPNPNPLFLPQPQFNTSPNPNSPFLPPPPPPTHDLSTSLSSLQTLLKLSQSTLHSLSSLSISPKSNSLIQCPSNPHHWLPPPSLFLHSLHCPSPLAVASLIHTLQYPKTLKSEQQLIQQNKFVQPLLDPSAELCFSLDDYVDLHSNFFYRDCPGVVSSINDDASNNRIFSLPGYLSVECANFVGDDEREKCRIQGKSVKVLPSEIWGVGCEVETWNGFPNECSYSVLRAVLCLEYVKERDVSMWVIVNSPRYGVIVDVAMSDHMLFLFGFCLKAVVREAAQSYSTWSERNDGNDSGQLNPKSSTYRCAVLAGVLKWLSLQLSILYGEVNANLFVLAFIKHWLPKAASYASVFPLGEGIDRISAYEQKSGVIKSGAYENERGLKTSDRLLGRSIFVYQIAAAIAALHERSLLEERIKALRNPMLLTPFQRNSEHAYLSKKANEERQKRHNYRALIEHDGLPSQKQHDQDTNKAKTREELLAEERDYKRRRMSYRGKKLKRTAKEVMRDIIEDYTEAIKQAGGIGCLEKGDGEAFSSHHDSRNFKENLYTADEQDGYRKLLHNHKDPKLFDDSRVRNERQENDRYSRRHFEDPGTTRRDKHYRSRSPIRDRDLSREIKSHRRKSGVKELCEDDHAQSSPSSDRSRHYDHKRLHSTSISSGRKDKRKFEYANRQWKQKSEVDKSCKRGDLNDRYDPSEAYDVYDDEFDDSKYMRPER